MWGLALLDPIGMCRDPVALVPYSGTALRCYRNLFRTELALGKACDGVLLAQHTRV